MSVGLKVVLSSASAQAELRRIQDSVRNPRALMVVVARKGANELKTHFRRRNRTPNKIGGKRTNFWQAVADSVQNPVILNPRAADIAINHPHFAIHLFGGRITPKNRKALTIPLDPLAHGRTVAVFQRETGIQLFLLRKKGGGMSRLLAGFVSEGVLKVFYLLSKGTTQKPDPAALPPQGPFDEALLTTARDYLDRENARANSAQ